MTAKQVFVRYGPGLDQKGQARLCDLIATGLDRYLQAKVDFAPDSRVYAVMASDATEATRC